MANNTANCHEEGMVVNVDHLMSYVEEMREAGSKLIKEQNLKDALTVYQQGIDAIEQTEELPMAADDVVTVVQSRSILHSNRAQIFLMQELFQRAIKECDEACTVDPNNAKAFFRRATAFEKTKEWAKAVADVKHLQGKEILGRNADFLNLEQLKSWQEKLEVKLKEYDEDFDERMEEAGAKNLKELREQFDEVIQKNNLKSNEEIASEIADMIQRDGGKMTAEKLAAVYQLDEDDADIMLRWLQKSVEIHKILGESGGAAGLSL